MCVYESQDCVKVQSKQVKNVLKLHLAGKLDHVPSQSIAKERFSIEYGKGVQ